MALTGQMCEQGNDKCQDFIYGYLSSVVVVQSFGLFSVGLELRG
jgi:hypothetical protein